MSSQSTGIENLLSKHVTSVGILECLRIADIQRLVCTSKRWGPLIMENCQDVVSWLRDLEALYSLDCRSDSLLRKMSHSIKTRQYRVMRYEEGCFEPKIGGQSLFEVLDKNWHYSVFASTEPFRFSTVHHLDLEEYEVFPGDAYTDLEVCSDEDKHDGTPRVKKQKTTLACSSPFCKQPHDVSRVYHVYEKPYCGCCLDNSNYLRLQFCKAHVTGKNTDWSVEELRYRTKPTNNWGLQENEFWVHIWHATPYNIGEIRFIGIGPRLRTREPK